MNKSTVQFLPCVQGLDFFIKKKTGCLHSMHICSKPPTLIASVQHKRKVSNLENEKETLVAAKNYKPFHWIDVMRVMTGTLLSRSNCGSA